MSEETHPPETQITAPAAQPLSDRDAIMEVIRQVHHIDRDHPEMPALYGAIADGLLAKAIRPTAPLIPFEMLELPWERNRGELLLEVHHVLTEPLCPTVTLRWETSGERIAGFAADSIEEGIAKAMERVREIARAEGATMPAAWMQGIDEQAGDEAGTG